MDEKHSASEKLKSRSVCYHRIKRVSIIGISDTTVEQMLNQVIYGCLLDSISLGPIPRRLRRMLR